MKIEPIAEFGRAFSSAHTERERERNKEGVRLGLSEFIDFNYFKKAKYFDFKDIKLSYFHCGLSNSKEEKFPRFIILLTPMYNSG